MALLWIDGFENYGTSVNVAPSPSGIVGRSYAVVGGEGNMRVKAGRLSGSALQLRYDSTCYLSPAALTTNATMIIGCALRCGAWPWDTFLAMYDGITLGMNLRMVAGEIAVYRGSTLIATTVGAGISGNTWFYLEFKVVCGTTGSYELRIGGVTMLINGSVNTKAGSNDYHTTFRLIGQSSSDVYAMWFDDLYVADGSGASNNDFLGNVRVVTLRPDAAGGTTQFTPDSGDNYARVNEAICGDDSNYVEDGVADEKDLYNYGALGGVLSSIKGIVITTDCRETDATNFDLKTPCKSGATESDDAGQAVGSTNYVSRRRLMETDPNTGVAWTPTNLEVAQFGVKVG
jgi:hypothetical protein